jgi:parvulin-like peptidyl-prolyl isomerase
VARVNGQPIRIGQVLALAQKGLIDSKDRAKDMPGAVRFALQQYIARELLLQQALADGLTADTSKVEAAFDQVRAQFKNEKAWLDSLADRGLDPQSFKQELRAQETVNVLMSREGDAVQVSDEEARAYFDANPHAIDPGERLRLQQVFFAVIAAGERARESARVKASVVQKRALAGEDFTKLAQSFSQDKATREAGGRLELKRGMKAPSYDAAAYALEPGQVSDIVDTPEGVYVLRLEERIPGPPPQFEDVKRDLKSALLSQKRQAAYDSLVNRLRAKARIETYL